MFLAAITAALTKVGIANLNEPLTPKYQKMTSETLLRQPPPLMSGRMATHLMLVLTMKPPTANQEPLLTKYPKKVTAGKAKQGKVLNDFREATAVWTKTITWDTFDVNTRDVSKVSTA